MSWDWQLGVLGDAVTRARLSPERQIRDLLRVEAAFSRALGQVGGVELAKAEAAAQAIESAKLDETTLIADAAQDGMPVPGLVRQLRALMDPSLHDALHGGLTSQDVMDTALMLSVGDCLLTFEDRLRSIVGQLRSLSDGAEETVLMGRTRMQAALPVPLSHRILAWRAPLGEHLADLQDLRERIRVVQMGGPVGTSDSFGEGAVALREAFAAQLGLVAVDPWHTNRTRLAVLGAWLARVTGSLSKIGHDVALMAQQGLDEVRLASGGRSSAMAHKSNPILAESLVSLGRDSSVQLAALHLALEHEQERSGVAWALEWLVLPRLMESTGAALQRADQLLDMLSFEGGV